MLDIDDSDYWSPPIEQIYERYLKSRDTILLRIAHLRLVLQNKVWGKLAPPQMLGATRNATDLIRLEDTAAVVRYLKLWALCCQVETMSSFNTIDCDVGSWIEMAIYEEKRIQTHGYMKIYA